MLEGKIADSNLCPWGKFEIYIRNLHKFINRNLHKFIHPKPNPKPSLIQKSFDPFWQLAGRRQEIRCDEHEMRHV